MIDEDTQMRMGFIFWVVVLSMSGGSTILWGWGVGLLVLGGLFLALLVGWVWGNWDR